MSHVVLLLNAKIPVVPNVDIGPFVDDRRMLGVLVGEVYLFSPKGMSTFRSHLDKNALTGWHDRESDLYRWTGARAELPDIRTEFETTVAAVTIHA